MRAAGAAILGAAVVGGLVLATSKGHATEPSDSVDFDIDAELALATNYYGMAITHPETWSAGQLQNLENFLAELGMSAEAANIADMKTALYGDGPFEPKPLPDITYIPPTEIDAIADQLESEL